MDSFAALSVVARRQRGLVTWSQLANLGIPPGTVTGWVRRGRLRRLQPRVYAVTAVPPSWEQTVLAAVLSSGGVAGMRSAARLWSLLDADVQDIDVVISRGRAARLVGVSVHRRSGALETAVRAGVITTSPACTLVMLGAVAPELLEAAVSAALVQRLVSEDGLWQALGRMGGPGHRGAGVLRQLLERWNLGRRPPDSVLETRMRSLLQRHQLPAPEFQHEVRKRGRLLARVDFAYPHLRLAIEVDGGRYHSLQGDRQRDARRRNLLAGAGWTVLVFTWEDVHRRGREVTAAISAQLTLGVPTLSMRAGGDKTS